MSCVQTQAAARMFSSFYFPSQVQIDRYTESLTWAALLNIAHFHPLPSRWTVCLCLVCVDGKPVVGIFLQKCECIKCVFSKPSSDQKWTSMQVIFTADTWVETPEKANCVCVCTTGLFITSLQSERCEARTDVFEISWGVSRCSPMKNVSGALSPFSRDMVSGSKRSHNPTARTKEPINYRKEGTF